MHHRPAPLGREAEERGDEVEQEFFRGDGAPGNQHEQREERGEEFHRRVAGKRRPGEHGERKQQRRRRVGRLRRHAGERLGEPVRDERPERVEHDEGRGEADRHHPRIARVRLRHPDGHHEQRRHGAGCVRQLLAEADGKREQADVDDQHEAEQQRGVLAILRHRREVDGEDQRHHGRHQSRVLQPLLRGAVRRAARAEQQ